MTAWQVISGVQQWPCLGVTSSCLTGLQDGFMASQLAVAGEVTEATGELTTAIFLNQHNF